MTRLRPLRPAAALTLSLVALMLLACYPGQPLQGNYVVARLIINTTSLAPSENPMHGVGPLKVRHLRRPAGKGPITRRGALARPGPS